MEEGENIIPEAGNLYSALRNSGYSNIAAIGDLIDNSLDAGAKVIKIDISNDLKQIFLSDDGIGMSAETLNRALKLGGRKPHDNNDDLGKYGLGLITASISMGTRLKIVTRKDKSTNVGVFDVNEVYSSNKFIASFRKADESEEKSFNFRTNNAKSGTVLVIDGCDKIQFNNVEDFTGKLRDYVKAAFWAFIKGGKEIIINNKSVPSEDPLYGFDGRTQVRISKTINIPVENGKSEPLEILAVLIPDFGKKLNRNLHINIETQGFYVLRNNREIASALEIIDVFKKHNDFNRLRIKLNFGPGLDELMGVNYTKHNISPSKQITGALKRELEDEIKKIRREMKAEQQKNKKEPKGEVQFPFAGAVGEKQPDFTSTGSLVHEKPNNLIGEVEIKTRFGEEKDDLFDFSVSSDKAYVRYNGANKFYREKIIDDRNGIELKKNLDAVLKALLEASIKNNVPVDVIEKIGEDIASALEKGEA